MPTLVNEGRWQRLDVDFDHVFEVQEDGSLIDRPDLFAPTLMDDELDSDAWTLWSYGYTGQYGYNGPILHNSEYMGGGIVRDLLEEPGVYVLLVSTYESDDPDEPYDVEGWAVAQLK